MSRPRRIRPPETLVRLSLAAGAITAAIAAVMAARHELLGASIEALASGVFLGYGAVLQHWARR